LAPRGLGTRGDFIKRILDGDRMKTIRRTNVVYEMSARNAPAAEAAPGETVRFFTEDAYSGTLRTVRDSRRASKARGPNPATGPLFVTGAKPGDVLAVEIISVRPVGRATMFTGPGKGPLGWKLARDEIARPRVGRGFVFVDKRRIPAEPMVGVIGVAPRGKGIPNSLPGEHGGNMDCNVVKAGSTVYLPVAVEGALLALGDVHAVQAAGEVAVCAAETRGEVTVRIGITRRPMVTPSVETKGDVFIVASAKSLDRAEAAVLEKAYRYLNETRGMGPHETVRLMSLACDMEICQVVDPLKTLRVRIPKRYL